jgi:hypothetical protein
MAIAISSSGSTNESRVVSHVQKLSPSPEREVVAIAFPPVFEIFRRLPILAFTKEFLVGDILATPKKISNVFYRVTLDAERLADIASHWKRGMRSSTATKWL